VTKLCSVVASLDSKEDDMRGFGTPVLAVSLIVLGAVAPVKAQQVKAGDLVITQAWSRATPNGAKTAAGYLTIQNKGTNADRLTGASADVAGKTEIHEMSMSGGVMKMRPLDNGLQIAAGKTVKLAPEGYHLMLEDLKNPLKQGDKISVMLDFEKAGKVQATLDVQGVGAKGPGGEGNMGGKMKMDGHAGMKM